MGKVENQKALPGFTCLDSEDAIDRFLEATHWLHDSCIQGFFVSNPMYVDSTGNMVFPKDNFPGESNLTVLFQSQPLDGCTIELALVGIDYFRCEGVGKKNDGIVLAVRINLDLNDGIVLICNPGDGDDFFKVKARSACWRLRRDLIDSLHFSIRSSQ